MFRFEATRSLSVGAIGISPKTTAAGEVPARILKEFAEGGGAGVVEEVWACTKDKSVTLSAIKTNIYFF
jgi:hypothetical protein